MMNYSREVKKVWGKEIIFSPPGSSYTGKLLVFNENSCSSAHFHIKKSETFFVQSGRFRIDFTKDGELKIFQAKSGDSFHIYPGLVHKVYCLEAGVIFEASDVDNESDSYRLDKSSTY
jgi:mannose-6-phosphate isomerase-like protein (cupin superfamily)